MIAASMIIAGYEEPKILERCLLSLKGQVDKIFLVITSKLKDKKLKEVAEKYATVAYEPDDFFFIADAKMINFITELKLDPAVKEGERIFQFDKARNYALDMIPKEYQWVFWIDVDDILRGDLKRAVKFAETNNIDSLFINYIYDAEIVDGKIKQVLIEHLRERLIKNDGSYKWIAPIHETLIEQRPTRKADIEGIDVLHLSTNERKEKAIGRNIPALQLSIYQKEGKDPRPLYYLGKAYYDRFQIKRDVKYLNMAKNLFEQYLGGENKSGWAEERSQCWEYLIAVYQVAGQLDNAIKCAHNAMIESETSPSIYINLAMCYLLKKEYERALFWVKMGIKLPQPKTTLIITPRDLMARAFEVVFHASLNLSKLDEAWAAAQKLIEIYPTNQEMQNRVAITNQLRDQRELTKSLVELSKYLESHGEGYKIKPLVMSAPELIKDNPFVVDLANKVNPPRDWEDNEVCIYCGPGFSTWSPRQLEDGKTFVGGSEEAVMYLAQALTKQGWKVTVYADPGDDEGDWDGVLYLPYYKWNKRDQFNIVVSWRRPDFVDQGFKAKKTYIWCHDIQQQMDYTPERLEKITKIIVLSPWHRTNLPDIPDDKIIISTNGIQL